MVLTAVGLVRENKGGDLFSKNRLLTTFFVTKVYDSSHCFVNKQTTNENYIYY